MVVAGYGCPLLWSSLIMVITDLGRHWFWSTLALVDAGFGRHWLWSTLSFVDAGFGRHCLLSTLVLVDTDFGRRWLWSSMGDRICGRVCVYFGWFSVWDPVIVVWWYLTRFTPIITGHCALSTWIKPPANLTGYRGRHMSCECAWYAPDTGRHLPVEVPCPRGERCSNIYHTVWARTIPVHHITSRQYAAPRPQTLENQDHRGLYKPTGAYTYT